MYAIQKSAHCMLGMAEGSQGVLKSMTENTIAQISGEGPDNRFNFLAIKKTRAEKEPDEACGYAWELLSALREALAAPLRL